MAVVEPKPDGRGMKLLNSFLDKYSGLQVSANTFAIDDPKILHDFGRVIRIILEENGLIKNPPSKRSKINEVYNLLSLTIFTVHYLAMAIENLAMVIEGMQNEP